MNKMSCWLASHKKRMWSIHKTFRSAVCVTDWNLPFSDAPLPNDQVPEEDDNNVHVWEEEEVRWKQEEEEEEKEEEEEHEDEDDEVETESEEEENGDGEI